MTKHFDKKRRRRELWEQDPHCHWCGVETKLYHKFSGGRTEPDQATLDHLYTRLDPLRYRHDHARQVFVLACYKCNWERGLVSQKQAQTEGNPLAFDSDSPERARLSDKAGGKS